MTAQTYPSPDADAWAAGTEYAPAEGSGLEGATLLAGTLAAIGQELSGIRAGIEGMRIGIEGLREDSAAQREQTEALIEAARAQDGQPPGPPLPAPEPDFYPFAELPAGTAVRDLPGGGKLFLLPDGLILRTGCENTVVAIGEDGEAAFAVPGAGGMVAIAPGRTLRLAAEFLRLTHEAAGIAGLPAQVEPVQSAPGRVSVTLPGGTRLGVHQDTGLLAIVNASGAIGIVGAGRIEGIGEAVQVRTLAGGLRSFTFLESGHAGVVEPDGTIQLCLAGGGDLTITFPSRAAGEDPAEPDSPPCPACGIVHPQSREASGGGAR